MGNITVMAIGVLNRIMHTVDITVRAVLMKPRVVNRKMLSITSTSLENLFK